MKNQINQLHEQAMERTDEALAARSRGDQATAESAFRQAFHLERAAAELLLTLPDEPEPTRSVLLRSAASLALDAGQCQEALRLIHLALAGNPPPGIADELNELLARVQTASGGDAKDNDLIEAKRFTDAVGGIEQARQSLEALSRLH